MRRALLVILVLAVSATAAPAQSWWKQQAKQLAPGDAPPSNFIQNLAATGDSLWMGPQLTLYLDGATDRSQSAECTADDLNCFLRVDNPVFTENANAVFGLDAPSPDTVWSGLAFDTGDGTPGAGGFLVSTDGGASFRRTPAPLDARSDTTVRYGDNTLPAIPVVEQPNAAPQDIDVDPRTGRVWTANTRAGIRWSDDFGETWNRAVLPPDTSDFISPDSTYNFLVGPPVSDGRGFFNHVGFSVLVDEAGVVWAGTPGGLNRSDSLYADGSRSWRRVTFDGTTDGLTGNSAVVLAEQRFPQRRSLIWIASWAAGNQSEDRPERFGVTVTPDGGDTYRQALIGEQVVDFAFRGETVYAAARESGLLVSGDLGRTWMTLADFELSDASGAQALPRSLQVRSVATTSEALWLGTSEGLLRLPRSDEDALLQGGDPAWTLLRTAAPVNPDEPTDTAPDVQTYAYPNPFSPAADEFIRIRFETDAATTVEVTIYDFGMNRVRTLTRQVSAGEQEVVWEGTDESGLRLPNGPYFYTVDTGNRTVRGKILIAE